MIAIVMMIFTIVSVNTFNRTDRNIFGVKAFVVLSDSMRATDFKAGDLVLVKEVEASTLKVGDIISYQSINPDNYGQVVTHKIREITSDAKGKPGFITYGTTNDIDDEKIVTYNYILGKYQNKVPGVGKFFQFLKTPLGYLICIFIPFGLLILMQGINSVKLFKQYKQEQLNELAAKHQKELQELEQQVLSQKKIAE